MKKMTITEHFFRIASANFIRLGIFYLGILFRVVGFTVGPRIYNGTTY